MAGPVCRPQDSGKIAGNFPIQVSTNASSGRYSKSSDPGLNTEPSASHNSSQHGWNIGSGSPETCSGKYRERNPIFCAGVSIEDHGYKDDDIAQEDRQNRLPPIHAPFYERTCQHISGYAQTHADPQCCVIPGRPCPLIFRHRCQVFAV
jgi:hypothetical protein